MVGQTPCPRLYDFSAAAKAAIAGSVSISGIDPKSVGPITPSLPSE